MRRASLVGMALAMLAGADALGYSGSRRRAPAPKKHDPEAMAKAQAKRERKQQRNLK